MKLPNVTLDLSQEIAEFDVWITPALGSIQETDKFRQELDAVATTFDFLANAADDFSDPSQLQASYVAEAFDALVREIIDSEGAEASLNQIFRMLRALASTMYLVTGKSDNNVKCQLPIHLTNTVGVEDLLKVSKTEKGYSLQRASVPRELTADSYMSLIASLYEADTLGLLDRNIAEAHDRPQKLLEYFIEFILSDDDSVSQLWSLGQSYCELKAFDGDRHLSLLAPLIIFQVRGSVTASGRHEPRRSHCRHVERT